ncbi:MAG: hypothetical protein K6T73_07685 [Candidatus Bathyarchaeota archaeon]|nr:hypothetical protein [Candidatus Bathyarchaeota archaeon]
MLRQLEQIPYVKDLVKRLSRNRYLQRVCGYKGKASTKAHFSQMKKRIGKPGFIGIESYLRKEANRLRFHHPLLAAGLIQATCFDGTDLPAWSSRDPTITPEGLGTLKQGLAGGRALMDCLMEEVWDELNERLPIPPVEEKSETNKSPVGMPTPTLSDEEYEKMGREFADYCKTKGIIINGLDEEKIKRVLRGILNTKNTYRRLSDELDGLRCLRHTDTKTHKFN